MKKTNKIIAVVMLVLLLFSSFQNVIYAATEISKANLTTIQDSDSQIQFKYDSGWTNVRTNYIGYYEGGNVYPAYCISHGAPGVDELGDYTVSIEKTLDDVRLWRTIINGFPYKSPSQLGVENEIDAYVATKQAIYCVILGRDVYSLYRGRTNRGDKIVDAIYRLTDIGRNGTQTPQNAQLKLEKSGNLYEEGNYYVQKYNISSAVDISSYTITNKSLPSGAIITNAGGTQKTTFSGNESCYLKIPKSTFASDINASITIQGKCKTYPVFYGETPINGAQNYAVTFDPYGDESAKATLSLKTNTGKVQVYKIDSETKTAIKGVTFQLLKADGTQIATATTDANGVATFSNIYQGNYKLREISTLNTYILNSEVFDISVEYNKTTNATITNVHKKGNIKINKTDSETSEPIANVTFQLIDKDGNVVQSGTTNFNGELYFNDIRVGDYKLKEISTHTNYVLNTTIFDVKVEHDKTTTKNITNDFKKGNIKINKTDAETSKGIEGVTFELQKNDGTVVATATTNSQGIANFNNIRIGEYKLKEVKTNSNYILNSATFDVKVEWNKTIEKNITNEHKRGNLSVVKVDKDNHKIALGNVIFDLFSYEFNKVVGTYVTNVDGEININNLRIGQYSLIEKNTGKWYNLADNTEVKVEWNKTTNTTIENELKKGKIKVTKVDLDNNEIVIPNVTFAVLDDNGKVLEEITTNEKGIAETSRFAIRDYATLTLKETKTDKWYVLNDKEIKVKLKENDVVSIQVENELKKGQIKVIKVDLDNNEVKLKGVKFNVLDASGNIVDNLVTDENGEAISKRLPINQEYKLQETKTLEKYDLNEEIKTITLEQDKITDITFTNELKKGQIKVIKVDLDNNEIRLKGIEFNILDESGNIVDTLITDENGEAISKLLRVNQKYTLQETKTLENYVLNEETQVVTLKPAEITSITFENEKIKGYIQVTKTSAEDNKYSELPKDSPLPDVKFEIYDAEDNLVDTITTDKDGKAVTKELLKGCYKIKEISSAKYYLLNTEIYNAEIVKDQEIVNVDITNDNVEIEVEIQKNGFIETQSKDDIFYNFKNIKNNSNVPLDNFTWSDHLPTDAVRINRLYTGTWNEDLKYDVYYKTNKTDEYVLFKEDLSTQKIYELNFKELKLAEDEYVTDYEFRFGKVKIGFQEIDSPILYCDILDGLGNGYVFTNKTKVKGNYFEKEVEDNDDWTTITYFKEIKVKEVLPRTRFLVI